MSFVGLGSLDFFFLVTSPVFEADIFIGRSFGVGIRRFVMGCFAGSLGVDGSRKGP
jgi:hypothetical protein